MSQNSIKITIQEIKNEFGSKTFSKGEDYYNLGTVSNLNFDNNILRATCKGTAQQPYSEWISFDTRGISQAYCSCPIGSSGDCKHVVAVLLAFINKDKNEDRNDNNRSSFNLSPNSSPQKRQLSPSSPSKRFETFGFSSVVPKKSPYFENDPTSPSNSISYSSSSPNSDVKKLEVLLKWQRLLILSYNDQLSSILKEKEQLQKDLEIKTNQLSFLEHELSVLRTYCTNIKTKTENLISYCRGEEKQQDTPSFDTTSLHLNHSSPPVSQTSQLMLPSSTPLSGTSNSSPMPKKPAKTSQKYLEEDSLEEDLVKALVESEKIYKQQKENKDQVFKLSPPSKSQSKKRSLYSVFDQEEGSDEEPSVKNNLKKSNLSESVIEEEGPSIHTYQSSLPIPLSKKQKTQDFSSEKGCIVIDSPPHTNTEDSQDSIKEILSKYGVGEKKNLQRQTTLLDDFSFFQQKNKK